MLPFASGGISSIAAGGKLVVGAAQAFVADSGAAGSNSALTGLGSVAGDFELQFGAALSLTGGLTVGGSLNIDTNNGGSTGSSLSVGGDLSNSGTVSIGTGFRSDGGSTLTISGNLSNSGTLNIHDDTATATVVTASTLTATTGSINLLGDEYGDGTGKAEVVLTSGAAPSSLSSTITLFGPSLLEFASGGISSIAAGGKLVVGAAQAFVADSGATGSNSALTGLSSVSGDFELQFGAALSLTGGLTVGGSLNIDTNNGGSTGSSLSVGGDLSNSGTVSIGTGFRSDGGSTLTITGNLSNSGTLNIHDDTATATVVTASTLTNSGTINLLGDEFGDGTGKAELDVNGAASSSGTISIGSHAELSVTGGNAYTQTGGTTTVTGTLAAATINVNGGLLDFTAALSPGSGTGDINIGGNGTVEFGAAVDAGHKVTFTSAAGTLELGAPNQFTPTIYGFSDGDTIDFLHTAVTAVSYANGVLTAMNGGTTVATINLSGPYFTSDFATSTDNNGGTDVKLGTNPAQATIQETSGDGTLSRNGSNYTLDFGTVKLGANALTADLEVLNSAIAPADALSGSFNIAANAAFTNGGFTAFSGVEAGQADPAPTTITFNTGSGGTFTETITLMPASSNGNGTASLPNETLTVTGTVAPPPAIVAPSNVVVQQGRRSRIAGVSVTDVYAQNTGQAVTVILGDTNGLLSANANASGGGGNIAGNGTSQLTIQGTLAQVNADLGTLTDLDSVLAPDAITINANDGSAAAPTQTVSVGVAISPVITTPFVAVLPQGQATPVMGIGISDVSPTNKTFTVTLADTYGRLSANTNAAGGGGTIKGAGTTVLKISGSLAQVNADLTTLTDTDSSANGDLIAIYANDGTGGIAAVQTVSVATSPSATIDWDSVKAADRPVTVDQADWDNIWTQFKARVGNTTASLSTALSQEATELAQIAQPNNNINSLIQFELLQVVGGLLPTYIAGASELRRQYDGSLLTRNNPGPFGYGWTFAYGISAISDAGGNVSITSAGGTALFTRQSNGSFVAESGRGATLSVTGGAYKLVDANGNVDRFLANGKLSSVTDRNGNTTSLNWDNAGNLLTVTSWTGKSISFTYNGFGRIASATSSNGTQFTYTYDPSGTLLLSATGPNGTTTYAYDATQGSASENALTEITNPDGTHEYLHYNAQGLLSEQYGDNGAGLITYSYTGAGQVTVTDALGDQNILFYGTNGKVARTQDALGNLTKLQYDEIGELTSLIGPDNSTWTYSYSASGGLTSYIDPLGGKVVITYEPGTRLLTGFTDQLGDKIQYTYDNAGNLTGITYQDGSGSNYQYNTNGLLSSYTTARGQTVSYSYNGSGRLIEQAFGDGTTEQYAYNAAGDLISAQARDSGVTSYTYNANNQLTSVTAPKVGTESFNYDAYGRLIEILEPNGSATVYAYDAAGRLADLRDGSGNLQASYTYNVANELVSAEMGNGTSTTYSYDAAGNVTQILDYAADGSVTGNFTYTYDAYSRPIVVATLDGTWMYGYNAGSELTSAVFNSTNSAIPDQNLSYTYDAAGNRINTVANGAASIYSTNGLDEYVLANGSSFTYDADGNLTSETDGTDQWTFSYDESNRLVGETGPNGTWTYEYDALGNLVAGTENGVSTNYVINPFALSVASTRSLSSVAQAYDGAGNLLASYTYGLEGLTAVADSAGNISYFSADLGRNITGVSGPNGNLTNSYFYLPYGETIQTSGASNNPFQFAGADGVITEAGGVDLMGARFYAPSLGRFITRDPSGISGGTNLYAYVGNDPVSLIDPTGLQSAQPREVSPPEYDPPLPQPREVSPPEYDPPLPQPREVSPPEYDPPLPREPSPTEPDVFDPHSTEPDYTSGLLSPPPPPSPLPPSPSPPSPSPPSPPHRLHRCRRHHCRPRQLRLGAVAAGATFT